ncbi:hypothetical protein Tco_0829896 [Tanacetum coccineum]
MMKARVLGLGGGGERKKKKKDDSKYSQEAVEADILIDKPLVVVATLSIPNEFHSCIPDVLKTRLISYSNVKSAVPPGESTDHLGVFTFGLVPTGMPMHNITVTPINESFDVKNREKIVSPTSTTMDNIQKLKANVPNDADYDVWLPLASVHEVNDRMKNSLHVYYIGKRLAFLIVECNPFEALNFDNLAIKEVDLGNKASTSGVQKEGQSSTPLVEKIKKFEQLMLEGKCVLVDDDDGNPLEMVDYSGDHDREDKVAPLDNEMASFLASQLLGVVYGTNSLLEQ